MRKAILVLALLLALTSSFGQNNNSGASGGKASDSASAPAKNAAAPAKKKPVPKPAPKQDNPSYSPCGVFNKNSAESNADDKWFSLGESANKHFFYNPHRITCEPKTGVLKSWIKEEHKNTDSDFALVLYEFKCKTNQMRVRTVIEYDKTGSVLETTNHGDDPWQDVAPNTAGETMMKTVCRRP